MGRIKQGILGGFSKSVANVVGSSWKGINVIKSKPLSVANPNTAGQQAQRGKMAQCVAWGKEILVQVIKPLWDRFAIQTSGWANWVKANIDAFDAGGLPNPQDVVISVGTLALDSITALNAPGGQSNVDINYTSTAGTGSAVSGDVCFAVVYNATQDNFGIDTNDDRGVAGAQTTVVTMPTGLVGGNVLHVYMAFRRADGTLVSNTSYDTVVVV